MDHDSPSPGPSSPARRTVLASTAAVAAAALTGAAAPPLTAAPAAPAARRVRDTPDEVEYVVIGSGPGGGSVAANLAEAGHSVLVLEAGPAHGNETYYDVPALHLKAACDPEISWDMWVRHYTDDAAHGSQWVDGKGILYPRAATLGGCSAHNATILMYPEHTDWAYIRDLTGDPGWDPQVMWDTHWKKVLSWQPVEESSLLLALRDAFLDKLSLAAKAEALPSGAVAAALDTDVNSKANVDRSSQGAFNTPMTVRAGRRHAVRERLLDVRSRYAANLSVATDALAERIVFEERQGALRATAVEYLSGRHLYQASPGAVPRSEAERDGLRRTVRVTREVIVAGGAFNTPQLLMLSGIGPREHLAEHGITPLLDLPGVGANLQDRYEVSVVSSLNRDFTAIAPCTFKDQGDPCLAEWKTSPMPSSTPYGANGVVTGIKRRASKGSAHPELFVFCAPGNFTGYVPKFDELAVRDKRHFSWLVLKGYAADRAGTVRLASADPTRQPSVNFRKMDDGRAGDADVAAMIEAVRSIRSMNAKAGFLDSVREETPGPRVSTDAQLEAWIRKEAWGHHASCTAAIGPAGRSGSVLDGQLRVHGTSNLRVVDASAFPRIPGLFIMAPTLVLAEKASQDILRAAR
ncbi:GMC family oxidoreductase N-terminal domain-containing protein [Streptomyces sp. NBC_00249]|uniref:GMC family oxidoreductase n=1 Tax=Streptomyces sp. NBC_00249 TaxID=2975690 RepID=UPI00224CE0D7|nr:GMC oxidoreductase [Streptomyces sp. NBC_00249]MCX5193032.1 GMC family oxidoreductase N-terminal domain-containing protein [Streptomyces sp. NBC_00249]